MLSSSSALWPSSSLKRKTILFQGELTSIMNNYFVTTLQLNKGDYVVMIVKMLE